MFYVERGPLSVYFYFGIDFKIKRRTFLDASVIHIQIFFPLLLSFYSRAFFLRRNFTTFSCYRWSLLLLLLLLLLTLCIQFYSFILPLQVNFILHLARALTHSTAAQHNKQHTSSPHSHTLALTHTHRNSRLNVCVYMHVHLYVVEIYVHVRRRHTHL